MKMPHKIMLQALVPVIIVASVVALLMNYHSQRLTEGEIAAFQDRMLVAKRTMLSSYVSLAQASIRTLYEGKRAGDPAAKAMAVDVLNGLSIDPDAGFFVYDFNGKSLVHPRQPLQVGQNRLKMTGPNGQPVVQQFISRARAGGGFQPYAWRDPETDKVRDRISYVVALDKWGWVLGASVNVDDVIQQVRETEIDAVTRTRQNAVVIGVLTVKALIIVVVTGLVFGLHERREADAKLKQLTQRIVETQEEERGRVARELHDGISQILVSVKYALELAQLRAAGKSDEASDAIANGAKGLNTAIREVRRISRDLRPAILDDLGLSPALESLAAEFSERTGIEVEISTVAFQSTLPTDAKTTLFRVAQEALTNIERHAHASYVAIHLGLTGRGVEMTISDDGRGFDVEHSRSSGYVIGGLGLRNMQERLAYHNGEITITSSTAGTTIEARLPRTLLRPLANAAKPTISEARKRVPPAPPTEPANNGAKETWPDGAEQAENQSLAI